MVAGDKRCDANAAWQMLSCLQSMLAACACHTATIQEYVRSQRLMANSCAQDLFAVNVE